MRETMLQCIALFVVFWASIGMYVFLFNEDEVPNPCKRRLLCVLCGPIAWLIAISEKWKPLSWFYKP